MYCVLASAYRSTDYQRRFVGRTDTFSLDPLYSSRQWGIQPQKYLLSVDNCELT